MLCLRLTALFLALAATANATVTGDCADVYDTGSGNCNDDSQGGCGRCFNGLGRSSTEKFDSILCPKGDSQGYYCDSDGGSFACMDWTFGSNKLKEAEEAFSKRVYGAEGQVWFGVGTFGTGDDPMQGLGNCYRMVIRDTNCGNIDGGELLERNVIAQSINTGHDVANIQFDLQMGNGGTGAFNNCAGQSWSMFPGPFSEEIWGEQYGGCSYRDSSEGSPSCDDLPPYPQDPTAMELDGDSLIDLCKYSFDNRVRKGADNPTIVDMARVKCPAELVEFTQVERSDDPDTYEIEEENRPEPYQAANVGDLEPCRCSCGAQDCKYCLTRMMDCRKPSAGFIDNMKPDLLKDGMKVVQPCTQDGYTRIDVKCGCMDCYC